MRASSTKRSTCSRRLQAAAGLIQSLRTRYLLFATLFGLLGGYPFRLPLSGLPRPVSTGAMPGPVSRCQDGHSPMSAAGVPLGSGSLVDFP